MLNISQHLASIQTEKIRKANKTDDSLTSELLWKNKGRGKQAKLEYSEHILKGYSFQLEFFQTKYSRDCDQEILKVLGNEGKLNLKSL